MTKNNFLRSALIATRGIAHAVSGERNIKIQLFAAVIVIIASLLLKISKIEFIFILIACFFVICMELINTAIEKLLDRIHPDHHEEIGKVKDIMASVVLLSVILAGIIGILILLKPLINLLRIKI